MNRYIVPAIVALVIALIVLLRHSQDPVSVSHGSTGGNHALAPVRDSAGPSSDSSAPARTKSKIRVIHRTPTIEETTELLRNTIIHPESKEPHDGNDPFSDPSSTNDSKPAGPVGEDDPFAEP